MHHHMEPEMEQESKSESLNSETSGNATTSAEPSLEQKLADAEARIAALQNEVLYARADTENLRRRSQEDVASAHKYAVSKLAGELLPVKDSLEMALADNSGNIDNLKMGVDMTLKQLVAAFDKVQLKEINPIGEKLDPHKHQAISMIEADAEPNTVINVMQKGYLLAERVLRPAMVVVAKSK